MSTAEVQDVQDDIHKILKEQHQLEQLGHHEHGHVNGVNGNGLNGHEEHHNGHQDEVDGGGHSKPRENHCDVTAAGEDDGVQDEAVKGQESEPAAPEHTEEKEAHRDSTEEEAHPAEPKAEAVVVEAHPAEPKAEAVVVEAHPAEPKAEAVVVEAHPAEPKAEAVVVEAHPAEPKAEAVVVEAHLAEPKAEAVVVEAHPAETKDEVVVAAHHEATADAHHEAHHEHPAEPRGEDDTGDTPVKELRQKYLDKRQSSLEMKREVESQSRPVINKAAMSTSVDERSVREAYEDVRSDTTRTDWAVFKFEAQKIVCAATGEGFDSFRDHFTDDERAFGFIRIQMGDEMSKRQKFVFLTWVGPQVSVIRRAKMTIDKGLVKDIIKNFAVELQVESQSEINVDYIREQLARAGGANYGTGFRD